MNQNKQKRNEAVTVSSALAIMLQNVGFPIEWYLNAACNCNENKIKKKDMEKSIIYEFAKIKRRHIESSISLPSLAVFSALLNIASGAVTMIGLLYLAFTFVDSESLVSVLESVPFDAISSG